MFDFFCNKVVSGPAPKVLNPYAATTYVFFFLACIVEDSFYNGSIKRGAKQVPHTQPRKENTMARHKTTEADLDRARLLASFTMQAGIASHEITFKGRDGITVQVVTCWEESSCKWITTAFQHIGKVSIPRKIGYGSLDFASGVHTAAKFAQNYMAGCES